MSAPGPPEEALSRARRPQPVTPGPRMPESVVRKRPAQIIAAPRPPAAPRSLVRRPVRGRTTTRRAPRAGRRPVSRCLDRRGWVFGGLFCVGMGQGNSTGFDIPAGSAGPESAAREFPVPIRPPVPLTIPSIRWRRRSGGRAGRRRIGRTAPPGNAHEAGWFGEGTPASSDRADRRGTPTPGDGRRSPQPAKLKPAEDRDPAPGPHLSSARSTDRELRQGEAADKRSTASTRGRRRGAVTCGGTWLGGGRGYSDNIIAFASLVSTKDT